MVREEVRIWAGEVKARKKKKQDKNEIRDGHFCPSPLVPFAQATVVLQLSSLCPLRPLQPFPTRLQRKRLKLQI